EHGARWSPDGARIALLSDGAQRGVFQVYLAEAEHLSKPRPCPPVQGTVEYLRWSPDGTRLLLGVAPTGTRPLFVAPVFSDEHELPAWMPRIESSASDDGWRWLCVYEPESGELRRASRTRLNVWEAEWAGNAHAAAVVSDRPVEDAWYTAELAVIDLLTAA